MLRRTLRPLVFFLACGAGATLAQPARWRASFSAWPADWSSPRQTKEEIRRVYRIEKEGELSFLRAEHDAIPVAGKKIPPAVHFGHGFRSPELRLADACVLSWKWRVLTHPLDAGSDGWRDLGASVYVVTRNPGLFAEGRGFKFGWLARSGSRGTKQRGILQIELRNDPAGPAFIDERIDLCALYERHFGPVADEKLLYVGIVTDADDSKSVARADYDEFQLLPR